MSEQCKTNSVHFTEFDEWLEKVSSEFKNMTLQKKLSTFQRLLDDTSGEHKYFLMDFVNKHVKYDLFTSLPTELQECVCHFIDVKSLLVACCVSKEWNKIISSLANVWRRKCIIMNMGSISRLNANWKHKCLEALKIRERMQKASMFHQCDISATKLSLGQITGLDYYDGLLIGSAENRIGIWRIVDYKLILIYQLPYIISCIQLNHNIIAVGHCSGYITTWELHISNVSCDVVLRKEHRSHTGVIMSISVSTEINLMVTGATDLTVKLWCLLSGTLLQTILNYSHWVIQVSLFPSSDFDSKCCRGLYYLFTMTRDHVSVFSWHVNSQLLQDSLSNLQQSCINFPLHMELNNFSSGCHIVEGNIIYLEQDMQENKEESWAKIVIQNVNNQNTRKIIQLAFKVRKLLAVGVKLGLLLLHSEKSPNLVVIEMETGLEVGGCCVPHSSSSTPGLSQVTTGEMKWLNDISMHHSDDLIVALGLQYGQIHIVRWRK